MRINQAKDLVIQQYKNSPKILALIESFSLALEDAQSAADDLRLKRTIDTAEGVNLDVIGKIVDLPRPFQDPDPELVFTFNNPSEVGGGFSGIGRADIGGFFIGIDPFDNALVSDNDYRKFIKAKIIRNSADGTLDDIVRYVQFVFDTPVTILNGIGYVDISVGRPLSVRERNLLRDTIPLSAGIRLRNVTYALNPNPFGFTGNSQNTGFSNLLPVIDGLSLWLDAEDTSTITQSSGKVSQWNDKSGNGNNAIQGTEANQPSIINNIITGKPVVRFDGLASRMAATLGEYTSVTILFVAISRVNPLPGSNTQTFMATAPSGTSPEGWSCTGKDFSSTTERRLRSEGDFSKQIYKNNVAGNAGSNPGTITDIDLGEIFSATYNFTSGTAKTDLRIGALQNNTNYGQHDFAEIIIFNRILSTQERTIMNNYLMKKWGLDDSLESGILEGGGFTGIIQFT